MDDTYRAVFNDIIRIFEVSDDGFVGSLSIMCETFDLLTELIYLTLPPVFRYLFPVVLILDIGRFISSLYRTYLPTFISLTIIIYEVLVVFW